MRALCGKKSFFHRYSSLILNYFLAKPRLRFDVNSNDKTVFIKKNYVNTNFSSVKKLSQYDGVIVTFCQREVPQKRQRNFHMCHCGSQKAQRRNTQSEFTLT